MEVLFTRLLLCQISITNLEYSQLSMQTKREHPTRVSRALEYFRDLWQRREFAWFLGMGRLKARNASTALGLAWWALNPLLLGLVYFLVFGVIFSQSKAPGFLSYLMSGMFVFHFTSITMMGGANSILQNSRLLANLRFPRLLLPLSNLIEGTVGFLTSIGVLWIMAGAVDQVFPTLSVWLLLIVIPVHVLFNLGLGALIARLAVPFRDINNFVPYLSRIWLYLSPILWRPERIADQSDLIKGLVALNPMSSLIGVYRTALLGYPFDIAQLRNAIIWALVMAIVGVGAFVKYEGRMVRYL
jgi:teichoic acid transport system permease protein